MFPLKRSNSFDEQSFEDHFSFPQYQNGCHIDQLEADVNLEPKKEDLPNEGLIQKSGGNKDFGTHVDDQIDMDGRFDQSKKMMHRDVERQRRKEMAGLYASLRHLLPCEYLKGKRAVSDQMQQAAKYIKHMEKTVKDLRIQRDKLKMCSSSKTSNNLENDEKPINITHNSFHKYCVEVNLCEDGQLEILINNRSHIEENFPLSKILSELIGKGLNVMHCTSTRTNEQSLYKIQIEANDDVRNIDLATLQDRLVTVINTYA